MYQKILKLLLLLLKMQVVCLMHSEAKQYHNVGVWSRERLIAGPSKETDDSRLKNPKLPKSFRQSSFIGKVREGHG